MKTSKLVTASLALGALSQRAWAEAKSRAQVQQELVSAQHEGLIPTSETQYPPSEEHKARNRATHAASKHGGEQAPSLDQHDQYANAK